MLRTNLKVKRDRVNGDDMLACKVLQRSSEEGLRKEKPGDPEDLQYRHTDKLT